LFIILLALAGLHNAVFADKGAIEFITDKSTVVVPEGSTATFRVKLKLAAQMSSPVKVLVARIKGDNDITLDGAELTELTFTQTNSNIYQTVTLKAAEDEDELNGTATIRILCSSQHDCNDRYVTARERDNDPPLKVFLETTKKLCDYLERGTSVAIELDRVKDNVKTLNRLKKELWPRTENMSNEQWLEKYFEYWDTTVDVFRSSVFVLTHLYHREGLQNVDETVYVREVLPLYKRLLRLAYNQVYFMLRARKLSKEQTHRLCKSMLEIETARTMLPILRRDMEALAKDITDFDWKVVQSVIATWVAGTVALSLILAPPVLLAEQLLGGSIFITTGAFSLTSLYNLIKEKPKLTKRVRDFERKMKWVQNCILKGARSFYDFASNLKPSEVCSKEAVAVMQENAKKVAENLGILKNE